MLRTLGSIYASCGTGYAVYLSTPKTFLETFGDEAFEFDQLFDQRFLVKDNFIAVARLTERANFIIAPQLAAAVGAADQDVLASLTSDFTVDVGLVFSAPMTVSDGQQLAIWGDGREPNGTFDLPPGRYRVIIRARLAEYDDILEFPQLPEEYQKRWVKDIRPDYLKEEDEEYYSEALEENWDKIYDDDKPAFLTIIFVPTVDPVPVTVYLPSRRVRCLD